MLDELGEKSKFMRDLVNDQDRKKKPYEKALTDYVKRLLEKRNGGLM